MKENVDNLTRLFDEGKKASEQFEASYNTIVPNRNLLEAPRVDHVDNSVFSGLRTPIVYTPEPEPEHPKTRGLLQTTKTYVDEWTADVKVVLDKTGKARYKVQFNDPDGRVGIRTFGNTTRNEEELGDILDDLELRLGELRKIIIDYEQSSERAVPKLDDLEPATYDPKTRTIFFADEAIRFNKNAEYSPAICNLMFADPDKLWQLKDFMTEWDSLYDYLPDLQKPTDWNKVYDIIRKMNQRVTEATGVNDLFKTTTKSVRLNPKYIAPTKKQP